MGIAVLRGETPDDDGERETWRVQRNEADGNRTGGSGEKDVRQATVCDQFILFVVQILYNSNTVRSFRPILHLIDSHCMATSAAALSTGVD